MILNVSNLWTICNWDLLKNFLILYSSFAKTELPDETDFSKNNVSRKWQIHSARMFCRTTSSLVYWSNMTCLRQNSSAAAVRYYVFLMESLDWYVLCDICHMPQLLISSFFFFFKYYITLIWTRLKSVFCLFCITIDVGAINIHFNILDFFKQNKIVSLIKIETTIGEHVVKFIYLPYINRPNSEYLEINHCLEVRPKKYTCICMSQVSRPYLGFCPDPKHFIANCEQNVFKFAGKWGKMYWKMQFLYKIFWQNKMLCRPTIPSYFRAETWNTLKYCFGLSCTINGTYTTSAEREVLYNWPTDWWV